MTIERLIPTVDISKPTREVVDSLNSLHSQVDRLESKVDLILAHLVIEQGS